MLPDLGVEGDSGVLDMYKELVALGNENNPVIVIGKQKGKLQGETWIEDNEVVAYKNCRHILHDLASTQV